MHLYQLTDSYNKVWQLVSDPEADQQAIIDTLESIEGAIQEKAGNIIFFLRQLETFITACDAEKKRIDKAEKVAKNRLAGLRQYVQMNMDKAGLTNIDAGVAGGFTIQNSNPSVDIPDIKKIAAKYMTVTITKTPDKKRIIEDLKAGKKVRGAKLIPTKSLRMK